MLEQHTPGSSNIYHDPHAVNPAPVRQRILSAPPDEPVRAYFALRLANGEPDGDNYFPEVAAQAFTAPRTTLAAHAARLRPWAIGVLGQSPQPTRLYIACYGLVCDEDDEGEDVWFREEYIAWAFGSECSLQPRLSSWSDRLS